MYCIIAISDWVWCDKLADSRSKDASAEISRHRGGGYFSDWPPWTELLIRRGKEGVNINSFSPSSFANYLSRSTSSSTSIYRFHSSGWGWDIQHWRCSILASHKGSYIRQLEKLSRRRSTLSWFWYYTTWQDHFLFSFFESCLFGISIFSLPFFSLSGWAGDSQYNAVIQRRHSDRQTRNYEQISPKPINFTYGHRIRYRWLSSQYVLQFELLIIQVVSYRLLGYVCFSLLPYFFFCNRYGAYATLYGIDKRCSAFIYESFFSTFQFRPIQIREHGCNNSNDLIQGFFGFCRLHLS